MTDPELVDRLGGRPVEQRELRYRGAKWDVVTDTVVLDRDTRVRRDVVRHPGAVGVVALDEQDRVLLLQQYRHPVEAALWEVPAGLLDEPGEDPLVCAQRELFEEAHLQAQRWDVLVDVFSSPGMCSEAYRVYLAREVSQLPAGEQHPRQDEERDMPMRWVPLESACAAVTDGRIHNAMAVVALLAAHRCRQQGWGTVRPTTSAWPTVPIRVLPADG